MLAGILGGMPRLARQPGVALMTPFVRVIEAFPPLLLGLLGMTLVGQGHWQEMVALTAALTPHMAGPSWENWKKAFRNSFDNIQRVARGERPLWVIPEMRG